MEVVLGAAIDKQLPGAAGGAVRAARIGGGTSIGGISWVTSWPSPAQGRFSPPVRCVLDVILTWHGPPRSRRRRGRAGGVSRPAGARRGRRLDSSVRAPAGAGRSWWPRSAGTTCFSPGRRARQEDARPIPAGSVAGTRRAGGAGGHRHPLGRRHPSRRRPRWSSRPRSRRRTTRRSRPRRSGWLGAPSS